jgi:hypothetical protein
MWARIKEMNNQTPETETETARIVTALREIFDPIVLRLAPDIEPATIYEITRETAAEPAAKEPSL